MTDFQSKNVGDPGMEDGYFVSARSQLLTVLESAPKKVSPSMSHRIACALRPIQDVQYDKASTNGLLTRLD